MVPGRAGHRSPAWPTMTCESPISRSACITRPSGVRCSSITAAPNAARANASSASAFSTMRYGVTVRYPSGIGFTATAHSSVDSSGFASCGLTPSLTAPRAWGTTAEPMTTAASRTTVLVVAVVGLAAATTSAYVHYRLLTVPNFTSFCDVNSTISCTQAYLSRYGELGGVPVAIFGALYFAIVVAMAAIGWRGAAAPPPATPSYVLALSIPALAFIAYLAYAALVVLNAFCILCAITYAAVIGITIVASLAPRVP